MTSIVPAVIALIGTVVGAAATVGAQLLINRRTQQADRARLQIERENDRADQRRERRVAQATELHDASVSLSSQLRIAAGLYDGLWSALRSYGTPASKEFFMERARDAWIDSQRGHAVVEHLDHNEVVVAFVSAGNALWHYSAELEAWYFTDKARTDKTVQALADAVRPAIDDAVKAVNRWRDELDPERVNRTMPC